MDTDVKGFIDKYRDLEAISQKMILTARNVSREERNDYLGQLQDAFIQYGEMLEAHRDWMSSLCYSEEIENYIKVLFDSNAAKLSEIIGYLEELCEVIYELSLADESKYEETVNRFKCLEGKIALAIRYEILSDYNDEANNNGLDRAADILYETSKITGDYYPIHILVNNLNRHYLPRFEIDDVAVVLQGQIRYEDDFTLETIYRYRRLYPNIPIIVSTWNNEVKDDFRWRTQTIGIDILENEYPEENGIFNINCQLVTSYEGIKYSKEKYKVKYAIKMRSDQRFYLPDFLQYMKNEIKLFPVEPSDKVDERLIFNGSSASVWSFPFRLADYWVFGNVNDLLKLYSASHSPKLSKDTYKKMWENLLYDNEQIINMPDDDRIGKGKEHNGLQDSEVFLARTYYENYILGHPLDYNIDDVYMHYWRFLREYTIIEDPQTLIMFWPKYKFRYYEYDCNSATGSLTHTSWLNLMMSEEKNILL